MNNKYHSLHSHSSYSVRDSIAKIEDIAKRNKELGIDSLCITDHSNLACMIEAIEIAKRYELQLILGIELYIVDETDEFYNRKGEQRNHILLLAKNYKGLQNIFKITSLSNKTKFNGYPRLTYQQFFELDFENIYVSGACSIGFLQRYNFEEYAVKLLDKFKDDLYLEMIAVSYINQKDTDKYNKLIEQKELTQQEQEFIDSIKPEYWIQQDGMKGIDGGKVANLRALYLHQKYQIPVIISVDSHYVLKEDADTHEVLTAINSRKKMSDPKRWRFGSGELYIHSYNELLEKMINLKYIPIDVIEKGLSYTNTIANNINLEFPNYYINLPTPFPNENDEDVLKRYIKKGLEKYKIHEKPNAQEYYDRINYEFNTLKEYKLSRYLLIIIDVYDFMEKNDIPKGSGRGSIGGCMIAYLCGLCDLDPLEYGLIFERFFNAGKVKKSYNEKGELILTADNMADIDFDVSHARRIEIINFLMERYGNKNVSQLSNYNYFTPKSAFKAVTSAFEIPFNEANKLSDFIEDGTYNENNKVVMYDAIDSFKYVKELQEFCNKNPHIYKHIVKLNKTLNAIGKHASAILICSHAIDDIATLDYDNGYEVCSLNMYGATKLSILKLDCLSINTADIIHNACDMIGIKQEDIPLKDKKTEALIASGMSSGIMQFESGLAKSTLKKIGRGDFKILVALNALLRPSALQSKDETGMTTYEKFIKTANGEIPLEYITPELEPILKDSYGCIVFQEDIMNIANKLGNFNLSESAVIMKAISKKKNDVIENYKPKFIEGCKSHNIDENKAITIFNIMIMAAKYCFNLSHSALYSCNSFRCGYLKANYPKQFWASTLSYASKADLIPNYIQEIKASDIQIKTPDINLSHATKYIIIDDYILAPLTACKWVGEQAAESIINLRENKTEFIYYSNEFKTNIKIGQKFYSMLHFNEILKISLNHKINKRCLASLFYSNAFKSLNHYEKDPKKASEKMLEYLPIFSPLPYIDLTQNIERDFNQIKSIANTIKQCAKKEYIKPIGKPSNVLCILEVGKNETQLLEVNTWFKSELEKRLNYQICVISPSGCKDLCENKCIDKLELFIQSIKPLLILNCSSKTSKLFGYKFGETFGNINYVEKFNCHLINIPSPAYMGFKKDIKDIYKNKIIPLLENYKLKDNINGN